MSAARVTRHCLSSTAECCARCSPATRGLRSTREGDAFFVAFPSARKAVAAGGEAQQQLDVLSAATSALLEVDLRDLGSLLPHTNLTPRQLPNPTLTRQIRLKQRDGASRTRTGDLLGAIQALSQLSYSPAENQV